MNAAHPRAVSGGYGLPVYAVLYLVFLYGPVLLLPIFSFNDSLFIAFPLGEFTTRWYEKLAEDEILQEALVNTLKVGVAASLVSTALGFAAAKALTRYRFRGKAAFFTLASAPLFIPDIVLGISLLILVSEIGLSLSLITVAVGHILVCFPFALAVMLSRLEGFDRRLEEAAYDLGESRWMTFWRVTFPLALPGVISSLLLTFIVSFDDFVIAFFLAGTEATLPVFIWGQLRFPAQLPGVLALGAAILMGSFVLVVAAEYLRRIGLEGPARERVASI
jgi:spermidine/putrescine transport system permease protein